MHNQPYVTITHYKEREFYYLNHAIQTRDGFIAKDIVQFHESEEDKFIEKIRELQKRYPKNQVVSLSLAENQVVKNEEDPNYSSARLFKENYVIQKRMDIGNIPVTLYFSPFALLYEEYKEKLDNKLTLMIGLFDRKLYIMFATKDKVHQSWILGTRGLSEKQIADRVYKSMKVYYKISFKFADHIEMLISDDSPKLLKVLREELSMSILPTQKTIHSLLHHMGAEQSRFEYSFIKSFLAPQNNLSSSEELHTNVDVAVEPQGISIQEKAQQSLDDIRLNSPTENFIASSEEKASFFSKLTTLFTTSSSAKPVSLFTFLPLFIALAMGGYFSMQNKMIEKKITLTESQSLAQTNNALLAMTVKDVFNAMGKNAELQKAIISNDNIELKGVVWGIEPLRNSLNALYNDGEFVIKPLENFMTEFSFKSKV
jgi:hypothetical protein